jgi:hypothetical protein
MGTVKGDNMRRIPRVYIAGRFRAETLAEVQWNIAVAARFQAPIAQAGAFPVCVHTMEALQLHDINQENDGEFWLEATMDELRTCDAVVCVPGSDESRGAQAEIAEARRLGMPVFETYWMEGNSSILAIPQPEPSLKWWVDSVQGTDFYRWLQKWKETHK